VSRLPDSLEIQLHPAGSGGRVRYLRPTRAQVIFCAVLTLLYLLLLAVAAGMAPGVVAGLFGSEEYRALAAERARQGERLLALVRRLEQLRVRSEALADEVRQVGAAYEIPAAAAWATLPAAGGGRGDAGGRGEPYSIYDGAVRQGERARARIGGQLRGVEAELAQVRELETAHPERVREMPAACPLRGDSYVLTNPFGREHGAFTRGLAFHGGIDLAAPRGTPIRAPADGVVVFAGTYPLKRSPAWWRFGQLVVMAHGERYLTVYGHCAELRVAARQAVRRGDVLATVGSSGWSLSPHLHYEVRRRSPAGALVPVNPLIYVLDRRWPDEERLLARARAQAPPRDYEPLPPGLDPRQPPEAGRRRRAGGTRSR
jgi:murein DD-endopeptidase MepM/ murein hydrolase activator NlpD